MQLLKFYYQLSFHIYVVIYIDFIYVILIHLIIHFNHISANEHGDKCDIELILKMHWIL